MTCYMLTWDRLKPDDGKRRQELMDFLDTIPEVVNWLGTTGVILLVSDMGVDALNDKIHAKFPKLGFFILPVTSDMIGGNSTKLAWDFIANPKPAEND